MEIIQNSGMTSSRRYFCFFASMTMLFFGCLSAVQWTQAAIVALQEDRMNLVRGVIVKFKDDTTTTYVRPHFERLKALSNHDREGLSRRQSEHAAQVIADTGLSIRQHRDLGNGHHVMHFTKPMSRQQLADTLRDLRRQPSVSYAEPDALMRPMAAISGAPNDPDFATRQWYLQSSNSNAGAVNMQAAWGQTTGNVGVVVAVLDTGIRPHADLAGRYLAGYDFVTNDIQSGVAFSNDGDGHDADPSDPGDWISAAESLAIGNDSANQPICDVANSSWHGTYVAGLLGAQGNNGAGIAGVNWVSQILPVRVSGKCGAYASNIIDGMRWAAGLTVSGVPANTVANKARVINISFGGSGICGSAYQSAIDEVLAAGALIVVAAGNEYGAVSRPGNCAGVMTIGAARHDGLKANYSNFGSQIALMAAGGSAEQSYSGLSPVVAYPGLSMWSTSNTGLTNPISDTYKSNVGTSFATPLVAGTASLMLSLNPALSPQDLMARLKATARPHVRLASLFDVIDNVTTTMNDTGSLVAGKLTIGTSNCTQSNCGAGLLDAAAAVAAAAKPAVNIVAPASAGYGILINLDGSTSAAATGATVSSYVWTQSAGSAVAIQNANSALAKVVMPATAGDVTFQLQVTDSLAQISSKSVTITARAAGAPTIVIAVTGSTVPGNTLTLNGAASSADVGATLTSLTWTQQSGTPLIIQNANTATATVLTPATPGSFVFRLTAVDNAGKLTFSDVSVVTAVPAASAASAASKGGGGSVTWFWGAGLWLLLSSQLLAVRTLRRATP
jgi:serine protease